MDQIFLQRLGKTNDPDRIEWAFPDTYSATDARFLANRRLRGLWIDPDDLRAGALRRAERDAFEVTALGLTPILEHDRNTHGNSIKRELFKRMTAADKRRTFIRF